MPRTILRDLPPARDLSPEEADRLFGAGPKSFRPRYDALEERKLMSASALTSLATHALTTPQPAHQPVLSQPLQSAVTQRSTALVAPTFGGLPATSPVTVHTTPASVVSARPFQGSPPLPPESPSIPTLTPAQLFALQATPPSMALTSPAVAVSPLAPAVGVTQAAVSGTVPSHTPGGYALADQQLQFTLPTASSFNPSGLAALAQPILDQAHEAAMQPFQGMTNSPAARPGEQLQFSTQVGSAGQPSTPFGQLSSQWSQVVNQWNSSVVSQWNYLKPSSPADLQQFKTNVIDQFMRGSVQPFMQGPVSTFASQVRGFVGNNVASAGQAGASTAPSSFSTPSAIPAGPVTGSTTAASTNLVGPQSTAPTPAPNAYSLAAKTVQLSLPTNASFDPNGFLSLAQPAVDQVNTVVLQPFQGKVISAGGQFTEQSMFTSQVGTAFSNLSNQWNQQVVSQWTSRVLNMWNMERPTGAAQVAQFKQNVIDPFVRSTIQPFIQGQVPFFSGSVQGFISSSLVTAGQPTAAGQGNLSAPKAPTTPTTPSVPGAPSTAVSTVAPGALKPIVWVDDVPVAGQSYQTVESLVGKANSFIGKDAVYLPKGQIGPGFFQVGPSIDELGAKTSTTGLYNYVNFSRVPAGYPVPRTSAQTATALGDVRRLNQMLFPVERVYSMQGTQYVPKSNWLYDVVHGPQGTSLEPKANLLAAMKAGKNQDQLQAVLHQNLVEWVNAHGDDPTVSVPDGSPQPYIIASNNYLRLMAALATSVDDSSGAGAASDQNFELPANQMIFTPAAVAALQPKVTPPAYEPIELPAAPPAPPAPTFEFPKLLTDPPQVNVTFDKVAANHESAHAEDQQSRPASAPTVPTIRINSTDIVTGKSDPLANLDLSALSPVAKTPGTSAPPKASTATHTVASGPVENTTPENNVSTAQGAYYHIGQPGTTQTLQLGLGEINSSGVANNIRYTTNTQLVESTITSTKPTIDQNNLTVGLGVEGSLAKTVINMNSTTGGPSSVTTLKAGTVTGEGTLSIANNPKGPQGVNVSGEIGLQAASAETKFTKTVPLPFGLGTFTATGLAGAGVGFDVSGQAVAQKDNTSGTVTVGIKAGTEFIIGGTLGAQFQWKPATPAPVARKR